MIMKTKAIAHSEITASRLRRISSSLRHGSNKVPVGCNAKRRGRIPWLRTVIRPKDFFRAFVSRCNISWISRYWQCPFHIPCTVCSIPAVLVYSDRGRSDRIARKMDENGGCCDNSYCFNRILVRRLRRYFMHMDMEHSKRAMSDLNQQGERVKAGDNRNGTGIMNFVRPLAVSYSLLT